MTSNITQTEKRVKNGVTETWHLDHPLGLYFAAYSAKARKDTRNQARFTKLAQQRLAELKAK